jgi:hypothetical protein
MLTRGKALRATTAAIALATGGLLMTTAQPAVADTSGPRIAAQQAEGVKPLTTWCTVDVAWANYRDAPNGTILGQVPFGTWVWERGWVDGWYVVDIWQGPQNVWMHYSVLSAPCG